VNVVGQLHSNIVYGRRVRVLTESIASVLPTNATVLDVGCGDGLISSRVVAARPDLRIEGIDVLVRPQTHIPVRQFDGSVLPYADDSFDLVVNHSVFTHLDDKYQDQWLQELGRITRPDGVLVLSFSGDTAFRQHEETIAAIDADIAAQERAHLEEHGILFVTDPVHRDLGFPGFYFATFHKPAYVLEHWQEWLELLAFIPRNNLDFQDAVVMRPRR